MKRLVIAAALLVVCACSDSTDPSRASRKAGGPASRDMDVNQDIPVATTLYNPCNGDVVPLTGVSHVVFHSTDATSGNFHVYVDMTNNYAGLGVPSGVNYQASERHLSDFSTQNPLPFVQTTYIDQNLVSSTGTDNFTFTFQMHTTVNANGEPTATIDNFSQECKG